jgi:hypothetical protein
MFPTSLGVAKLGLHWQPIPHCIMNIASDLHFTLLVDSYNEKGRLKQEQTPLHKIPHCCLGEFNAFEGLFLYAFFPKLALHAERKTTFLTDEQQSDWLDSVFLPALYAEHKGEDGLLQHLPTSYESAKATALAHSTEQATCECESQAPSRQQVLKHYPVIDGAFGMLLAPRRRPQARAHRPTPPPHHPSSPNPLLTSPSPLHVPRTEFPLPLPPLRHREPAN